MGHMTVVARLQAELDAQLAAEAARQRQEAARQQQDLFRPDLNLSTHSSCVGHPCVASSFGYVFAW